MSSLTFDISSLFIVNSDTSGVSKQMTGKKSTAKKNQLRKQEQTIYIALLWGKK